nr:hypothetical protein [Tanacetum cinerariifolium]
ESWRCAYKLDLPEELSRVHNTFHVFNLKKCHANEPLAVPLDGLHFDDKLYFVEEPVEIMDREVKRLKRSQIPLVKHKPMEFQVGDKVMLKVSPWKRVVRFGKRGKLNPRCSAGWIHLDDKLHFMEEPVEIVNREVKRLKQSQIPLVQVRWNSKRGPEFT